MMNETQTLEAIDAAIKAIQDLQTHSMVAAAEQLHVAQENLTMIRRKFAKKHAKALQDPQ